MYWNLSSVYPTGTHASLDDSTAVDTAGANADESAADDDDRVDVGVDDGDTSL
jgi:hypothetical protein